MPNVLSSQSDSALSWTLVQQRSKGACNAFCPLCHTEVVRTIKIKIYNLCTTTQVMCKFSILDSRDTLFVFIHTRITSCFLFLLSLYFPSLRSSVPGVLFLSFPQHNVGRCFVHRFTLGMGWCARRDRHNIGRRRHRRCSSRHGQ